MKTLTAPDLGTAAEGSFYTIRGVGGPLAEWLAGYEGLLEAAGIGKPQEWFQTTGAQVNFYAQVSKGGPIRDQDQFQPDLGFLLFPLDGLDVGKLAIFRLRMEDVWFDDMIANMRRA